MVSNDEDLELFLEELVELLNKYNYTFAQSIGLVRHDPEFMIVGFTSESDHSHMHPDYAKRDEVEKILKSKRGE